MTALIDIDGVQDVADSLNTAAERVRQAVAASLDSALRDLAATIADTKLSGQVLNARSGSLRASLQENGGLSGDVAAGAISSAVPYAAIHEYGGVIDRVARVSAARGRRLRRQATAYKIVEPEASYLRSTLEEQMGAIKAALTDAALEALEP